MTPAPAPRLAWISRPAAEADLWHRAGWETHSVIAARTPHNHSGVRQVAILTRAIELEGENDGEPSPREAA